MAFKKYYVVDFETASPCDLKAAGAWRYAEDPNTEILCLCWADGTEAGMWRPDDDPGPLTALVADPDVLFIAHNVGFEKAIWRTIMVPFFGFPDIPDERWHDTMAVCAMKVLPLSLDRAVAALGLPVEKDMAGSRLTISLSKTNKAGMYIRSPDTLAKVYRYCDNDVEVERALHRRIGWLPPEEREVWLLDQRINQRGVTIDLDFVRAAKRVVAGAMKPMGERFAALTGGLRPSQGAQFLAWLHDNGAHLPNLQKATLTDWLGSDPDGDEPEADDWVAPPLREHVAEALRIRQVAGSASIKKLDRMEACVCADGRVRGLLQYHGAGPGRWAGRLFQPHNYPRPTLKVGGRSPSVDAVVAALMTGDAEHVRTTLGDPIETVISGLRHAQVAGPGNIYHVGDFAGIEARVVLALAGQHDKTAMIASGVDVYCDFASVVKGFPVNKKDHPEIRQNTGKPGVLGCGFGMGPDKLAKKEGIPVEDAREIVRVYREDWAPEVPKVWRDLEGAATRAVQTGKPHEAFGCRYAMEDGWLTVRMPSGRKLWYWNPRQVRRAMPWDETDIRWGYTYQAMKQGRWVTVNAYGGLLTENIVQALARDCMVHSMLLCETQGLPIVLTIHDEIIAETEEWLCDPDLLKQVMEDRPRWAIEMGLPIEAETWVGPRYRKG